MDGWSDAQFHYASKIEGNNRTLCGWKEEKVGTLQVRSIAFEVGESKHRCCVINIIMNASRFQPRKTIDPRGNKSLSGHTFISRRIDWRYNFIASRCPSRNSCFQTIHHTSSSVLGRNAAQDRSEYHWVEVWVIVLYNNGLRNITPPVYTFSTPHSKRK